ncbi:Strumpellin [Operophtera brumata]|uniref:Strumpellin n=1 Tax=Operophtera brumata TaxID=104452 RepID=A0A0L7LA04_OPEBR|nr:Strumpellin [Operophtera brumata]
MPEEQASALATQASMLVVCLYFTPHYLHTDTSKMREIADKFFPSNWVVPVYMGVTLNLIDSWDNFRAAKTALANTINAKTVKEISAKRGNSVQTLINKTHQLLKEGTLTDDFVLDNINKILNILLSSNVIVRWVLLHNSDVIFYDTNKKSKQLRDVVLKESHYDPLKLLELVISTAELELKVREVLNRLLENRTEAWNKNKLDAQESLNSLAELFSGEKPIAKIPENQQLKLWFESIAKQVVSLGEPTSSKSIKKVTQLLQALEEVEEFHGIKTTSTIVQFLSDSKDALKYLLRTASLKEDSLVTLETVADVSYAWCTIDLYTKYMQNSIKEDPSVTSRLRSLFLKMASAMEIPLLRINQAHSDDLVSVSQYYSNELIKYIQKVLQIIPEMVFNIVEKIIDLQTWTIKEVPTRLEKERLRDFAQLDHRMEVAKLTHSASTFTTELERHISKKFEEFIEPQGKKVLLSASNLLTRLQKLSESMDAIIKESVAKEISLRKGVTLYSPSAGFMGSLARQIVQLVDASNSVPGLRARSNLKEISLRKGVTLYSPSAGFMESLARQIVQLVDASLRKGVTLYSPSAGFMGSLARQIVQLVDARICTYISVCTAWFDVKTQHEIINTKTFSKLNEAIGVVGLHGLDMLYAFMIKNQMLNIQDIFRANQEKIFLGPVSCRDIEPIIMKMNKTTQQMSDVLVLIGTLQIIRKHIAYQLNTSCKFDSAHLEASLRTLNDDDTKAKVSPALLQNLEDYLLRSGIYEPYDKIYVKNIQEFLHVDMGDLTSRKPGENIDGYPLIVGIYTLLHQTKTENVDAFVDFICSYTKFKYTESPSEGAYYVRIMELFCETFHYSFEKLENKLPMMLFTHHLQIRGSS